MCRCRPNVRTPCCGSDACHAGNDGPCPWCARPKAKPTTELEAIAREIEALSPPAKLRLAADLMEKQRGELAHTIASAVVDELGAAIALRDLERLNGKWSTQK